MEIEFIAWSANVRRSKPAAFFRSGFTGLVRKTASVGLNRTNYPTQWSVRFGLTSRSGAMPHVGCHNKSGAMTHACVSMLTQAKLWRTRQFGFDESLACLRKRKHGTQ